MSPTGVYTVESHVADDLVAFDNITEENMYGRYQRMSSAIAEVATDTKKAPFLFSLCEWGWQQPWIWGKNIAQSWRVDGDISKIHRKCKSSPDANIAVAEPYWSAIAAIIDQQSFIWPGTDFYGHNDLVRLDPYISCLS